MDLFAGRTIVVDKEKFKSADKKTRSPDLFKSLPDAIAASRGGEIRLGPGTYSDGIESEFPLTIIGTRESVIRCSGRSSVNWIANGGKLVGVTVVSCAKHAGIKVNEGARLVVENVAFDVTCSGKGFWVSDGGMLKAVGCTLTVCKEEGCLVQGENSSATITKSEFSGSEKDSGVVAKEGGRVTLTECRMSLNNKAGVRTTEGGVVRLESCQLANNAMAGLWTDGDASCSVDNTKIGPLNGVGVLFTAAAKPDAGEDAAAKGEEEEGSAAPITSQQVGRCEIFNNETNGVKLEGLALKPELTNNDIHDNSEVGIVCCSGACGSFKSNKVHANKGNGVDIKDEETKPSFSGNKVFGNGSAETPCFGISITSQGQGDICNNEIHGNDSGGIVIEGAAAPLVSKNKIESTKGPGILINKEGKGQVKNNTISGTKEGIHAAAGQLPESSELNIQSNSITGTTIGILISDGTVCDVKGNTVLRAQGSAISCCSDANPSVNNNTFVESKFGMSISAAGSFKDNVIKQCDTGVRLMSGCSAVIEGTTVVDSKTSSVHILPGAGGTMKGGKCHKSKGPVNILAAKTDEELTEEECGPPVEPCTTLEAVRLTQGSGVAVSVGAEASLSMSKCEVWAHAQGGVICEASGTLAMSDCSVHDEEKGGVVYREGAAGTVVGLKTFRNTSFGLQIETADVELGDGNEIQDAFVCSGAAVKISTAI